MINIDIDIFIESMSFRDKYSVSIYMVRFKIPYLFRGLFLKLAGFRLLRFSYMLIKLDI